MHFNIPLRWGLLLITCFCITSTDSTLILSIPKLLAVLPQLFRTCWDVVEEFSGIPLPFSFHRRENMILDKLTVLTKSMEALSINIQETSASAVSMIVDILTKIIKVEVRTNDLEQYAGTINTAFRDFLEYSENRNGIAQTTLMNFATSVVSHDAHSVKSTMERIHLFIVTSGSLTAQHSLPKLLLRGTKALDGISICDSQQSPQQMLYNFYNNLVLLEIKGYTMVQFSYMLLRLYGNESANYTTESNIYSRRFMQRSANTLAAMKPEIMQASRYLRQCDPKRHVEGETFIQITQFLQGYIQNEVDLNKDGSCKENCAAYTYTKSYSCFENLYCRQQKRCMGQIYNCKFVTSHMTVCPSSFVSRRRYDYIEYDNGLVYGRKSHCKKEKIHVESWWRWLFWHCSYCMCLCDEEGKYSDRYISLREVTSDILNNKVITGIRFIKVKRIIHLQIQQGELQMDGMIVNNTVEWAPVKEMNLHDPDVYNGQDYFTLTWSNRAINLDDISANTEYVLTGVKLSKVGPYIYLEIRTTPFNFTTGKLLDPLTRSSWKHNLNSFETMTEIELTNPDVPTRTTSPTFLLSDNSQYIRFTHTDFDKDAAQTTVPFFDAQPVFSKIPVPLSGVGIYYKGQKHFGGFIAPRIITYDYTPHLQVGVQFDPKINEVLLN